MKKIGLLVVALFLLLVSCAHYVGEEDDWVAPWEEETETSNEGSQTGESGEQTGTENKTETSDENGNGGETEEGGDENVLDPNHLTIAEAAKYINGITDTKTYTLVIYDDTESSCEALKEALNNLSSTKSSGPYISLDLTEATLVKKIEDEAFAGSASSIKYALKEIVLPKNCTEIGGYAFSYQIGLQIVVFPENLESIGEYTFYECGLTAVNLSKHTSLKSIGDRAFWKCTSLTTVNLSGCMSLTDMGDYTFDGCTSLTTADLSNTSLKSIGDYVFCDCTLLKDLGNSNKLPTTITEIGYEAFDSCSSLTTVNLSGCTSLQIIGYRAFRFCSSLTSVDLSQCTSLIEISYQAFKSCSSLTTITMITTDMLWGYSSTSTTDTSSLTKISDFKDYAAYYLTGNADAKIAGGGKPEKTMSSGYNYYWYKVDDE